MNKFETILAPVEAEPARQVRCKCGHEFWIDPTTEEGLYLDGNRLRIECPKCGAKEEK